MLASLLPASVTMQEFEHLLGLEPGKEVKLYKTPPSSTRIKKVQDYCEKVWGKRAPTGGGKSQYEKAMVLYLALRYPPLVKLALSDVKLVSLTCFNGLPHLLAPVAKDAVSTLQIFNYLVAEQELRYQEFKRVGVENINEYNQMFSNCPIPRIVSVTDECFDLLSDTTYKDNKSAA